MVYRCSHFSCIIREKLFILKAYKLYIGLLVTFYAIIVTVLLIQAFEKRLPLQRSLVILIYYYFNSHFVQLSTLHFSL